MSNLQQPGTVLSVQAARSLHAKVKAEYLAVAHTLGEGQRRVMRGYLARLTGMVKQAERDEWMHLQSTPTPHLQARTAVELAMAQARMASLAIADVATPVTDVVDPSVVAELEEAVGQQAAVISAEPKDVAALIPPPPVPASTPAPAPVPGPALDIATAQTLAQEAEAAMETVRDRYLASLRGDDKEAKIAALKASLQQPTA